MQKVVIIVAYLLLLAILPVTALEQDTGNNGLPAPADQPVRQQRSASEIFNFQDTNFDQLYNDNKFLIDFIIFLLIFLGITLVVYPDGLGKGHKPLTIGLSLALSLGLVMWERKNLNGESIFQAFFGTISLVFFIILIIIFAVLAIIRMSGGTGITPWLIFFLIVTLLCLWILFDPGNYFYDMTNSIDFDFQHAAAIGIAPAALGLLITFFFMKKKSSGGP